MSDFRLTPRTVRGKRFSTTRLVPGYAQGEVDAFLDQVEAEIALLIRERDSARAELGRVGRPGPPERVTGNGPHP